MAALGRFFGGRRDAGRPFSQNGASSFHLWWDVPAGMALREVSVVLEILIPPAVAELYFWALQVDFVKSDRRVGAAHTGLQWNRRYPGGTAVNWGGYRADERGGGVLAGTDSELPGFPDDPHTLAYEWVERRPYEFRVHPAPGRPGSWRAELTDLESAVTTVVRDLHPGGDHLASPVVWSEVFATCDSPSVTVRWSRFRAWDASGALADPGGVRVAYQEYAAGGCTNTVSMPDTSVSEGGSILQVTNTERTTPQGAFLRLA